MSCAVAILCLSNIYVQAESGIQQVHTTPSGTYLRYDRNEASPWLAAFAVGYKVEVSPKLDINLSFRHESMPTKYDYGVNAVWASVTWRPFK